MTTRESIIERIRKNHDVLMADIHGIILTIADLELLGEAKRKHEMIYSTPDMEYAQTVMQYIRSVLGYADLLLTLETDGEYCISLRFDQAIVSMNAAAEHGHLDIIEYLHQKAQVSSAKNIEQV